MLAIALALAAFPAHGLDWSFKAFGTIAAAGTDTNSLIFTRDNSQTKGATSDWGINPDSRLGLQLDLDLNEEFHAMAQWVARNHAGNFIEQNLDWAFLRWRPRGDLDVRLGRLGLDAFFLSEYRNIGYAYPWMRPPSEFYGLVDFYNYNGVDIAKRFRAGEGQLTLKGFAGQSIPSVSTVKNQFELLLFGVNLGYESGNWKARLGYVQIEALNDPFGSSIRSLYDNPQVKPLWPGIQPTINFLNFSGKRVHYSSLGLAYDDGVWPVQAEASYLNSDWITTPNLVNGYLSAGRRFDALTLYSLYGFMTSLGERMTIPQPSVQNPDLIGLKKYADTLVNPSVSQMSASLGLRWDVYENIDIKVQWSHFWLGSNGGGGFQWLHNDAPIPSQVNVWSFGVDFVY